MANLLEKANILITPTAYSDGKIHSAKPIKSLGVELVTNGDYNQSGTGNAVSQSGGLFVNIGGSLKITSDGSSGFSRAVWDTYGTSGQTFIIKANIVSKTGSVRFINVSNNQGVGINLGSFSQTITLGSSGGFLGFGGLSDSGFEIILDNISIKEVIDSDLNFTRGSAATRVNAQGLVENVDTLGSEAVVNGDFNNNLNGWNVQGNAENWQWNNGKAELFESGSVSQSALTQLIGNNSTVYELKILVDLNGSDNTSLRILTGEGDTIYLLNGLNTIKTTLLNGILYLKPMSSANIGITIDNVSLKEVIDVTNIPRINYKDFQYEDSLGSDKVVNGDFATDSDWTYGSDWSIFDSKAIASGSAFSSLFPTTSISVSIGKTYKINFQVTTTSGSLRVKIGSQQTGFVTYSIGLEDVTLYLTASDTSNFSFVSANFDGSIDNVSVKEVTKVVTPNSGVGSWLIEPQSTNLITYSEDFSSLNIINNAVVTSNSIISPSGLLDADEITFDGTSVGRVESSIATTIGQPYTISLYLKNKDLSDVTQVWVGFSQGGQGQFVTITNEWQRYDITTNADGTTEYPRIQFSGSGSLYAWGFQTEQQSFATSYIPTNGSVQTRLAETASRSGLGDLIDSIEGVFYAEFSREKGNEDSLAISINDGGTTNSVSMYYFGADSLYVDIFNSSGTVTLSALSIDTSISNKIAVKYKSGDSSLWLNGVEVSTNSEAISLVGLNELSFDYGNTTIPFYGNIKAVSVLPILTDQELECLTTR